MEFTKNIEKVVTRLSEQVMQRIEKIDLDSILSPVGLQVLKPGSNIVLPMAVAFGTGAIVGALLTPLSGKDLRSQIRQLALKLVGQSAAEPRELTASGEPVASPYEEAKADRDHRETPAPRKGGRPMPILEASNSNLPSAL